MTEKKTTIGCPFCDNFIRNYSDRNLGDHFKEKHLLKNADPCGLLAALLFDMVSGEGNKTGRGIYKWIIEERKRNRKEKIHWKKYGY